MLVFNLHATRATFVGRLQRFNDTSKKRDYVPKIATLGPKREAINLDSN